MFQLRPSPQPLFNREPATHGFSLVEVLVSAVVLLVAVAGSVVAFNVITQSVRSTGLQADQSRRIDAQIAEISRLSEVYTACGSPAGAVPPNPVNPSTACTGSTADVQVGNSFYYFPDPANPASVNAFFMACRSLAQGTHITANFRLAIDGLPAPGGGITRQPSTRLSTSPSNHLVEVRWTDADNRILRAIQIAPIVSTWCP